jgi:chromosome segregation ATPase
LGARLRDAREETTTTLTQTEAAQLTTCAAVAKPLSKDVGGGVVQVPATNVGLTAIACPQPEFGGTVYVNCTKDGTTKITETCKWRRWNEILMDEKFQPEMIQLELLTKMKNIFQHHVHKATKAHQHAANTKDFVKGHCNTKHTLIQSLYGERDKLKEKLTKDDHEGLHLDHRSKELEASLVKYDGILQDYQNKIDDARVKMNETQNGTLIDELWADVEHWKSLQDAVVSTGQEGTAYEQANNDWNQLGVTYAYAQHFDQFKMATEELEVELTAYQSCMATLGKMEAFAEHVTAELSRTKAIYEKCQDLETRHPHL